ASHEQIARAAGVHVVDLRAGEQRVEGVALERLRDLQTNQLDGLLEERMLDGQLSHVGDGELVTPLLRDSRHLLDRHRLADGWDAFRQRSEGKRDTLEARRGVGSAAALRQNERVAELVGHELTPRQRQSLVGNEGFNVRRELRCDVRGHVRSSLERLEDGVLQARPARLGGVWIRLASTSADIAPSPTRRGPLTFDVPLPLVLRLFLRAVLNGLKLRKTQERGGDELPREVETELALQGCVFLFHLRGDLLQRGLFRHQRLEGETVLMVLELLRLPFGKRRYLALGLLKLGIQPFLGSEIGHALLISALVLLLLRAVEVLAQSRQLALEIVRPLPFRSPVSTQLANRIGGSTSALWLVLGLGLLRFVFFCLDLGFGFGLVFNVVLDFGNVVFDLGVSHSSLKSRFRLQCDSR